MKIKIIACGKFKSSQEYRQIFDYYKKRINFDLKLIELRSFLGPKKLEKEKSGIFESDIILGIYYLKNSRHDLAKKFFLKANNRNSRSILDNYIVNTLYFWSDLENKNFEKAQVSIDLLDNRFENLKKIQKVFLSCFYKQQK